MNDTDRVQRLEPFDYGVCAFGAFGALRMLGVFGNAPTLLIFLWGLFSIGICALSVTTLLVRRFTGYLFRVEHRAHYFYLLFNLVPASRGYCSSCPRRKFRPRLGVAKLDADAHQVDVNNKKKRLA